MISQAGGSSPRRAGDASFVVLVVEDEGAVRRIVERILRRNGYEVIPVSSAEDALVILQDSGDGIDIVLTDIVMPRTSGIELLHEMKRLRLPQPVILMSGYTAQGVSDPSSMALAEALLAKPFNEKALLGVISSAISDEAPRVMPSSA